MIDRGVIMSTPKAMNAAANGTHGTSARASSDARARRAGEAREPAPRRIAVINTCWPELLNAREAGQGRMPPRRAVKEAHGSPILRRPRILERAAEDSIPRRRATAMTAQVRRRARAAARSAVIHGRNNRNAKAQAQSESPACCCCPLGTSFALTAMSTREARTNKVDLLLVLILLLLLFGGGGGLYWGFGVGWGIGPIGLIVIVIIVAWLLFGYRGRRGPRL